VKVDVKATDNAKGKITIPFSSKEEFERIKKLITGAL
jgi:ParB family chromosome partitioning protein